MDNMFKSIYSNYQFYVWECCTNDTKFRTIPNDDYGTMINRNVKKNKKLSKSFDFTYKT